MSKLWMKIALIALAMGGNMFVDAAAPAVNENATQPKIEQPTKEELNASLIESAAVAKQYVDSIDQGEYAQSWSKSDPILEKIVTQDEWKRILENIRQKFGKVVSRKVNYQRPAWNPPGLPAGAYMVVMYDTSFQNKPNIHELVTLRKGEDNKWRVLTYEVKK